jgi:hypothetical protein
MQLRIGGFAVLLAGFVAGQFLGSERLSRVDPDDPQ